MSKMQLVDLSRLFSTGQSRLKGSLIEITPLKREDENVQPGKSITGYIIKIEGGQNGIIILSEDKPNEKGECPSGVWKFERSGIHSARSEIDIYHPSGYQK